MSSDSNTATRPFADVVSSMDQPETVSFVVDGLTPTYAVRPQSVEELSEVVRTARADGLSVIPRGGGTQMGIGNLPARYDVAVDLSHINDVLRYDPDDMTMEVQSGCNLQELNDMLGEHRQVLPVDAAFPDRATIGGMTAVGASGPRRLGYGPLRDLIIGMSVMSVDGVVTRAGGQVVKNVTGFDMMRLHHGALGSLGIVISVNLKVIPKPQSERTVIATYETLEQADAAAREVAQSQLGVTALVVTNPGATAEATAADSGNWAIAVRCEAPPSAVLRQAERVTEYVREGALDVGTEDSTEASLKRWSAICLALDQRNESPDLVMRLGRAASKLRDCGETASTALHNAGNVRITLDYGSGLAYVRVAREDVTIEQFESMRTTLADTADHLTIMTAPADLKQDIDVFGGPPSGFTMAETLKKTFDPDLTFNPGRTAGRL